MLSQVRAAVVSTVFFTLLLGVAYPLVVTGVAQLAFPAQAAGSLIRDASGAVVGSALIGQGFSRPEYLRPRPSAAGSDGYDASASSGSNLGPTNPALAQRVARTAADLRAEAAGAVPADAITTSGSGLDPHVSPDNARRQAARIAAARGVSSDEVLRIIDRHVVQPPLGILGEPAVNVLETNLDLDRSLPARQPAHP